jgi:hypothetical protein
MMPVLTLRLRLNSKYKEKYFSLTAHGGEQLPSTGEAVRKMQAMADLTHN